MKATEAAKLTLHQHDRLYDKVMHQIRQDAIDGKSSTVYYLYPEYSRKDYLPLINRLKEAGYNVKFQHIDDPRDGDYSQIKVSWKTHIMDASLAKVQKELEDSVETFDEMIDSLYKYAEKCYSLGKRNNEHLAIKYNTTAECARNIARRIEKTWERIKHGRL